MCAAPGERQVTWNVSFDYTTSLPGQVPGGHCRLQVGTVSLLSCCDCPENSSDWLTLEVEWESSDCGDEMCKVTPVLTIPEGITCFTYYELTYITSEGEYGLVEQSPINNGFESICVPKGTTVEFEIAIFPGYEHFSPICWLKATTEPCEKPKPEDCYPNFDEDGCRDTSWMQRVERIGIPGFPNCPLTYTYYSRVCDGEYQIKGAVISLNPWWYINCRALLDYLSGGEWNPANPQYLPERLTEVFNDAFREAADLYFNRIVGDNPPMPEIFDCDNPPETRRNIIVTYHRGSCISFCRSIYYDDDGNHQIDFGEDNCGDGTSCCKITREYCLKFNEETREYEKQVTEKIEVTDNDGFFDANLICYPILIKFLVEQTAH